MGHSRIKLFEQHSQGWAHDAPTEDSSVRLCSLLSFNMSLLQFENPGYNTGLSA